MDLVGVLTKFVLSDRRKARRTEKRVLVDEIAEELKQARKRMGKKFPAVDPAGLAQAVLTAQDEVLRYRRAVEPAPHPGTAAALAAKMKRDGLNDLATEVWEYGKKMMTEANAAAPAAPNYKRRARALAKPGSFDEKIMLARRLHIFLSQNGVPWKRQFAVVASIFRILLRSENDALEKIKIVKIVHDTHRRSKRFGAPSIEQKARRVFRKTAKN